MNEKYTANSRPSVLDISLMIAGEDDPKARAFLIVLNSINLALEANAITVREISFKLETHLITYSADNKVSEEMINKGKGAWKIIAWAIGVAQVVGMAAWIQLRSDLADIATASRSGQITDVRMNGRLDTLEGKKPQSQLIEVAPK